MNDNIMSSTLYSKPDPSVNALNEGAQAIREYEQEEARLNGYHPSIIDLAKVQAEPVDWLWYPYLPKGAFVMLEGESDLGKTFILLDIIARLSSKQTLPNGTTLDRAVGAVYINYEDDIARTIKPRLAKAGTDFSKVRIIQDVQETEEDTHPFCVVRDFDLDLLRKAIQQVDAEIVVIDPITEALGAKTDFYKDTDVRRALYRLHALAEELDITVIMVRHHKKGKSDNMKEKGAGSGAFVNKSRVGIACFLDPEDQTEKTRLFVHFKHNLTPEADTIKYTIEGEDIGKIVWGETTKISKRQIMEGPSGITFGDLRKSIFDLFTNIQCWIYNEIQSAMQGRGYSETNIKVTLNRMVKPGNELKRGQKRGEYCKDGDAVK